MGISEIIAEDAAQSPFLVCHHFKKKRRELRNRTPPLPTPPTPAPPRCLKHAPIFIQVRNQSFTCSRPSPPLTFMSSHPDGGFFFHLVIIIIIISPCGGGWGGEDSYFIERSGGSFNGETLIALREVTGLFV